MAQDISEQVSELIKEKKIDSLLKLLSETKNFLLSDRVNLRLASFLLNNNLYSEIIKFTKKPAFLQDKSLAGPLGIIRTLAMDLADADISKVHHLLMEKQDPINNIAMIMMFKDESDVILANLSWHYNLGIRKFCLVNNNSADDSLEKINLFIKKHPDAIVFTLNDPIVEHIQSEITTGSMRFMLSVFPDLQWILPVDADEFLCIEKPLHQILEKVPPHIDALLIPKSFYTPTVKEEKNQNTPFWERQIYRQKITHISAKVILRAKLQVQIKQGNHGLSFPKKTPRYLGGYQLGLHYREYRTRSLTHFRRKIINGGNAVFEAESKGLNVGGQHWKTLYNVYLQEGESSIEKLYRRQFKKFETMIKDPLLLGDFLEKNTQPNELIIFPDTEKENLRKTIYLHIGLNKVGSTTLQNFLSQNRQILLSQNCLYLKTGSPPQVIHGENHNLAWFFGKHPLFNPSFGTWSEVHQEITSTTVNNIIISSEYFSILNPEQIKNLQQELTNYNTKIVVYLRRQDTRSVSLYVQGVKQNNRIEPIEEVWEKLKQDCNYEKKLAPWGDYFGVENIIVRPLERTQIEDIRQDFLQIIGINEVNIFKYSSDQNKSPNQKLTEILRFINEILIGKMGLSESDCLPYKQTLLRQYFQGKLFVNDPNNYTFLPEKYYHQLLEQFENSNSQVAKQYLGREDGILFYEKPSLTDSKTIRFKIDDLTETNVREIALCLLSHHSPKDLIIIENKLNELLNNSSLTNKQKLEDFLLELAKCSLDK